MPKRSVAKMTGGAAPPGACPLCWKVADKRDRTNQNYHIECAKQAAEIIMDLLHSKRGIVYEECYSRRYPNRPVPGKDTGYRPPSTGS